MEKNRRLANFEGGVSNNSGTSFSAPSVTGSIAEFAHKLPELKGKKLQRPYDRHKELVIYVESGRVLKDCKNRQ